MLETEEFIDVLTSEGELTGEVLTRAEVHQRGLWHRTVHLWVLNTRGELLLQLRAPTVHSDPNRWDISSAGHIPAGESSRDGAVRELFEELGIIARPEEFEFLFTTTHQFESKQMTDRAYNDVYLVQRDVEIPDLILQPEEVAGVRWMSWSKLPSLSGDPNVVEHDEEYGRLYEVLRARLG